MKILIRNKIILFIITVTVTFISSCGNSPDIPDRTFTLIILPDTQIYSQGYPEIFTAQTEWIVDNKEELNIAFVLHVGDVVDDSTDPTQWENADKSMSVLDDRVPYSIAIGNHDQIWPDTTAFNSVFNISRYEDLPSFGGTFEPDKMENCYHFFTAGGINWLIVVLEYATRDAVLEWANEIVSTYNNRQVIILTHAYMYYDDTRQGPGDRWNPVETIGSGPVEHVNDGEGVWNKLVKRHSNISFVFSGHVLGDGVGTLISVGDNGNKVYQMLSNYQEVNGHGNGFLRIVALDPSRERVSVETFSPYKFNNIDIPPYNEAIIEPYQITDEESPYMTDDEITDEESPYMTDDENEFEFVDVEFMIAE